MVALGQAHPAADCPAKGSSHLPVWPAGGRTPRRNLLRTAAWIVVLAWAGCCAAAPTATVFVDPAPEAVLAAPPSAVTVRLPGAAPAGAELEVLGPDGTDRGAGSTAVQNGTLLRRLGPLAPATYTVIWTGTGLAGSSSFTYWNGGPLPPRVQAGARGGPPAAPEGRWAGLAAALALLQGLVVAGSAAFARRRGTAGIARRAAAVMALAAGYWALAHAAAVTAVPIEAVTGNPLARAVLARGVSRDALWAAAAAVLAMLTGRRAPYLAALAGAVGLGWSVAAVPALHGAARPGLALLLAVAALCGAAAYGGAWACAYRARGAEPALTLRLAGLVAAVGAGVPLLLRWQPLDGWRAAAAAGAGLLALVLGRPATRSRAGLAAAMALGTAAAALLAPALAAAPLTRPPALPQVASWAYHSSAAGAGGQPVQLQVASLAVGSNVLRVTAAGWDAEQLPLTLSSAADPEVSRRLLLPRVAPGTYEAQSLALSLPGAWAANAAGAGFVLDVGRVPLAQACPLGLTGMDVGLVKLGTVRALAADPGDGDLALAATGTGIYATSDGGLDWQAVGGPHDATAVAFGTYGSWYAATPGGLQLSSDGGASWAPVAGLPGAVQALAAPLYPGGTALWAAGPPGVARTALVQTPQGFTPGWLVAGPTPAGLGQLLALPQGTTGSSVTLLATTAAGLQVSADGKGWSPAGADPPQASLLGAGAALWAGGARGLWTAPAAAGPWTAVDYGGGAVTGLAVSGPAGQDVLLAVTGRGLLRSTDGGHSFTVLGCPQAQVVAMTGTYSAGAAIPGQGPLAYLAASTGEVLALQPPAG